MKRVIGVVLLVSGMILLILSVAGEVTSLGDFEARAPRAWERFDPALAQRARSYDALLEHAARTAGQPLTDLPPDAAMQALYLTVADRFSHGLATHNAFSNWLLWLLSQLHPAFGVVSDEHSLVSAGTSLFCSQSSFVLLTMANDFGITARHVGLNGHVVMEAYYDGGWHMYDPDMEVTALDDAGAVLSVSAVVERADLLAQAYAGPKAAVIPFFLSGEDNTFMSYPPGAWFIWKAQVLYLFEQAAGFAKYLLALLLLAAGVMLGRNGRPDRSRAADLPVGSTGKSAQRSE